MNILIVGGGGREHAIVRNLARTPGRTLYCAPGNAGMEGLCTLVPLQATDIPGLVQFAVTKQIDFVVVAPDDPLALGLVDMLMAAGVPAFGPTRLAARIESSKIFSKSLMKKYNIPTAEWEAFETPEEAIAYIREKGAPIVVKADGLALGKGVFVAQTVEEGEAAVHTLMESERFAKAGARVVVEEFLTGPEVTVLAFSDGVTLKAMPPSRDHKRAFDGDQGPNTGGMGAISPAPGYTPELHARAEAEIFLPTLKAMTAEGCPFVGVIYFGLMLTPEGPKVIEYNARFGDPEAQAVLMLLETDLYAVMTACVEQKLHTQPVEFRDEAACCVVLASGGYPDSIVKGYPIAGLDTPDTDTLTVFHAGTARDHAGRLVTAGGRVLGVTARAATLPEAIDQAYARCEGISFEGMHYRRDIGRGSIG